MGAGAEAMAVEEARDGSSSSILGRRTSEPEGLAATEADTTPTQLEGSASAAAVAMGGSGTLGTLPAAAVATQATLGAAPTLCDSGGEAPGGGSSGTIPGTLRDEGRTLMADDAAADVGSEGRWICMPSA